MSCRYSERHRRSRAVSAGAAAAPAPGKWCQSTGSPVLTVLSTALSCFSLYYSLYLSLSLHFPRLNTHTPSERIGTDRSKRYNEHRVRTLKDFCLIPLHFWVRLTIYSHLSYRLLVPSPLFIGIVAFKSNTNDLNDRGNDLNKRDFVPPIFKTKKNLDKPSNALPFK